MRAKRCPFFHCTNVKKNGIRRGLQRYVCKDCGASWQSKPRPDRRLKKLWHQYAFDGRTVRDLARSHKVGETRIRSCLAAYVPPAIVHKPRVVAVVMDVTYFDGWGMLVVIDPTANTALGENTVLYYAVLEGTERTRDYEVATDTLESLGYCIIMATIDGRRGVKTMLEDHAIPVQYCQFHQLMAMTRCLTRRPRLAQNVALRHIALTLTRTDITTFAAALADWYEQYGSWLKERDDITGRYAHERTRRAYFSLIRNLDNLFTYQHDYMQAYERDTGKKPANTTNALEGRFGVWKDRLTAHRGTSKQRTITILRSFFSERTD